MANASGSKAKKSSKRSRRGERERAPVGQDRALAYFKAATGISNEHSQNILLNQAIKCIRLSKNSEQEQAQLEGVISLMQSIAPKGALEGMLATQMIATHMTAMECLARASHSQQSFEGRQMNLAHAEKLLAIYARQVETLDKHRGKGQQQVTVKHVHVESGGQAVVGNVRANALPGARKETSPALAAPSEPPRPMTAMPVDDRTRRKRGA